MVLQSLSPLRDLFHTSIFQGLAPPGCLLHPLRGSNAAGPTLNQHDPNDDAIREGDPPYVPRSNLPDEESSAPPMEFSQWLGHAALACACVSWLGAPVVLLADMGHLPRGFIRDATLLTVIVCWYLAVGGSFFSIVIGCYKTGCLALLGAFSLMAALVGIAHLIGSGWKD